jgi:hypothetical protein
MFAELDATERRTLHDLLLRLASAGALSDLGAHAPVGQPG